MAVLVNIFGGPGVGKTTIAAEVFIELSKWGKTVHLMQEKSKVDAWLKKPPTLEDQVRYLAETYDEQAKLLRNGRPEVILSDSPVALVGIYTDLNGGLMGNATHLAKSIMTIALGDHSKELPFLLERMGEYVEDGRFQSEVDAKRLDRDIAFAVYWHYATYYKITVRNAVDTIVKMTLEELKQADKKKEEKLCVN